MARSVLGAVFDLLRLLRSARVRRYLALTFFVDAGLVFILLVAIQSYLPEQYGASEALAGYVLAAYGASKLAGQLGAGWLIDRIGPRRGLIAGLCLTGAGQATMILGIVQPEAVLPAALLYGLGSAVIWPSAYALAAGEFEESERARLSAGMTVTTGVALATALCLGLALPASFPYAAAIAVCVAFTVGALAAARSFSTAPARAEEATRDARRKLLESIREIVSARRVAFSLIILLQAAILGALLAIFRSYGRETLQVSLREEMLLLLPAGAIGAGAVVLGGLLADRFGRIPVLGSGYLLATFSIWALSTTTDHSAVVPLAALCAAGLGLALPCTSALSLDLSRSVGTGTLLGWFLTMEGAGHVIGPAAGAWLNHKGGAAPVFWLAGGIAAAIAIVALVPPIWARRPDVEPVRHRLRALLSGTAKGALVFSLGFPVIFAYFAWDSGSQLYGDMITHGPRDRMEVAITFDDGPNDPWTLRIADTLDQYGVKGTFFTIGQNADAHPEIVQNLVQRGELIGNHSYRHRKSDAVMELGYGELWRAETAIAHAAGVCPAIYRPPNGFHTPWQLHTVAKHGMKTVTWDVIPRDWKDPPSDVIVRRVLDSVQPGSIVLLHDGDDTNQGTDRSATLNALPGIIEGLRAKGYDIVRLDQLLSIEPYLPTCDGLPAVNS